MRVLETPWKWMNAREINACMDAYDSVQLDMEWCEQHNRAVGNAFYISSDLPRALETAILMTGTPPSEISDVFREVPLPRFNSRIILPAVILATISRLGWYFGWMKGEESRQETTARVKRGADILEDRVSRKGRVTLFAHGFYLWLLMRELRERGWDSRKKGPFSYMEAAPMFKLTSN
ncbi:MAG: histidine phosphatase family protein [Leptospirales bacterium]|nr:histidine phosphatase family protein [Leptospirales bacterium]